MKLFHKPLLRKVTFTFTRFTSDIVSTITHNIVVQSNRMKVYYKNGKLSQRQYQIAPEFLIALLGESWAKCPDRNNPGAWDMDYHVHTEKETT